MASPSGYYAVTTTRTIERNGTVTGMEQNPSVMLAVAGARVYHTKLAEKESEWIYSRWKGTLTFGRDTNSFSQNTTKAEKYWFRLSDNETGRTVWMFRFPDHFEYVVDRPFFHVFQGRTRRYGFLFDDDDEASYFGQKVQELFGFQPPRKSKIITLKTNNNTVRSKSLTSPIARSTISSPAPNSFKHIAHVGVNNEGIFETSKDLDSAWKAILADMQGHGVNEVVVRHSNFGDGFWKGVEARKAADHDRIEGDWRCF